MGIDDPTPAFGDARLRALLRAHVCGAPEAADRLLVALLTGGVTEADLPAVLRAVPEKALRAALPRPRVFAPRAPRDRFVLHLDFSDFAPRRSPGPTPDPDCLVSLPTRALALARAEWTFRSAWSEPARRRRELGRPRQVRVCAYGPRGEAVVWLAPREPRVTVRACIEHSHPVADDPTDLATRARDAAVWFNPRVTASLKRERAHLALLGLADEAWHSPSEKESPPCPSTST